MFLEGRQTEQSQFRVQKGQIEWSIVNNDLRALHKRAQLERNLCKLGFIAQKFGREAMYGERFFGAFTLWIEIKMAGLTAQLPIDQFNAADFDNTVARLSV